MPERSVGTGAAGAWASESDAAWARLKQLFRSALELQGDERERFLAGACTSDPALREELDALLAADEADGDFLRAPASRPVRRGAEPGTLAGQRVGRFRVLHRIGKGGMGEVYLAERADSEFEQRVALKVHKRGIETKSILRRFAVERRVLAALDHPGICRLLDAGTLDDGRPYLVMEHVEGVPIDRYCDERRLSVRERLTLFRKVCDAVQFAHAQLVLHRDLKPANVFVDATGTPKLLDFGIAKLLEEDSAGLTSTGGWDRPMTLEYASPEQVEGGNTTVASDVYSLGVLLYVLLTGHPPFQEDTRRELEHSVLERDPVRPSTAIGRTTVLRPGPEHDRHGGPDRPEWGPANSGGTSLTPLRVSRSRSTRPRGLRRVLSGDLDNIVLKALRKEPGERHASVELLSQELLRFLEGQPVHSRRPTLGYRAGKFVRRNRALTAAGLALFLSLGGGIAGTAWKAVEAGRARDRALLAQAETAEALAQAERARGISEEVTRFLQELFESAAPGAGDRNVTVREVMVRAAGRLETTFAEEPEVRAAVRTTLATSFLALGELDLAEAQVDDAVAIHKEDIDSGDDRLALALILQGSVRYARGRLSEAATSLERALHIARAGSEPNRVRLALIQNNLGAVRRAQGDYEAAEALFRGGLETREAVLGAESLEVAESLNNLSGALRLTGRLEEAEGCLKRALEIRRLHLADDHPLVLQSISNLAVLYAARGELAKAEPLLRESIESSRETLGPDHPSLALDLSNLASVLRTLGRLAEAEDPLLECLDIRRRTVPDSTLVPITELYYGRLLVELDRLDEAEELLLEIAPTVLAFESGATDYGEELLRVLVELYEVRGDSERAAHYTRVLEQRSP